MFKTQCIKIVQVSCLSNSKTQGSNSVCLATHRCKRFNI